MLNQTKQTLSWLIGLPAALIVASELDDPQNLYIQLIALALLIIILCWNGAFKDNQYNR